MSKFTTPAILEMLDDYRWRLVEPFSFWLTESPEDEIVVPAGYITDLASVPRILWTIFPPHGRYAKAAIVHDYLYDNALRTKREADDIFLDAMGVLGVPWWRKRLMYLAVRAFGRGKYKRYTTKSV